MKIRTPQIRKNMAYLLRKLVQCFLTITLSFFYHIHCNCSGAYIANKYNGDFNFVTVLINPDTGNLVDIEHINYYYEFIGGSNSMTFTRPYSAYTKYLYPYYNGNEPETW